jgi:3-hydroxyisobutyrate dehydrogenase-like beta-hydroxyacid dehydrogenase
MGRAMAGRLLEAGHRVQVWNRSRRRVDELTRQGAEAVAGPGQAFGEVLVSMLADDVAVREVVLAPGMLEAARARST